MLFLLFIRFLPMLAFAEIKANSPAAEVLGHPEDHS
jgi:hypothetical protein